jgi:uncharacterized 2Fe-2S/4Fe-4S cluster protein (DUF4445 family)
MAGKHTLCDGVYLTPKDVRNLQLAKAAIRGGMETLLSVSGTKGKIKAFYLAGGMGNSISITSAVRLGLIPEEFADISIPAGNSSLSGASAILLDDEFLERTREIASECEILELADSAEFGENFIKYMTLGD